MNVIYFNGIGVLLSPLPSTLLPQMKRSRSESPIASSSSTDDSSDDDSSTISTCDSYESEKHSPKPKCLKSNDQNFSIGTKQGSSPSSSSSSSKRTDSSITSNQTKRSKCLPDKSAQQKSQTASKKIKNGNATHASPTKRSKTAIPKKKQIIEVIDSSASEYSPSDDQDGTESSDSSESENEKQKDKEPVYKKIKLDSKGVEKAEPSYKTPQTEKINRKKHVSGIHRTEGKEFTRFTREEDAAIMAFIENKIAAVDLIKHLRDTFPDQPPRNVSSVRYHRKSIMKKFKELLLGTEL